MRLYRVHCWTGEDGHSGFKFFSNRADAEKAVREWDRENTAVAELEAIEVEPTKAGILAALNTYANHADNG